jgi:hypothetical protein
MPWKMIIMDINLKRHQLLRILSKQRIKVETKKSEILGISFDEIFKELKCNEDELVLITAELYDLDEIKYFDFKQIKGVFVRPKGLKAFSNEKYLKIKEDIELKEIESKKTKAELDLAEKTLNEFPKTKWFARIGFIIGIILMLKELYILIWK